MAVQRRLGILSQWLEPNSVNCIERTIRTPADCVTRQNLTMLPFCSRCCRATQIQKPAGMTAFFGITTMPSRIK